MGEIQPPSIAEPDVERVPSRRDRGGTPHGSGRRRVALTIAIGADVIQWIAFPLFVWGGASPCRLAYLRGDILDSALGETLAGLLRVFGATADTLRFARKARRRYWAFTVIAGSNARAVMR
jgi:hypothetical protein